MTILDTLNIQFILIIGILLGALIIIFFLRKPKVHTEMQLLTKSSYNNSRLESSLWFDDQIGEFKTIIKLGKSVDQQVAFEVIPDTGSHILIVSGPECVKCPVEKGMWKDSLGTLTQLQGTISYGGGQVTKYRVWKSNLVDYDNQPINFGVITASMFKDSIDNSNNSNNSNNVQEMQNILGLQDGHITSTFLSQLKEPRNVVFDFPKSRFYIGQIDDILESRIVSSWNLIAPQRGLLYPLSFITEMNINGTEVPKDLMPTVAIWDTGTTRSMVDPDLYAYLSSLSSPNFKISISFAKMFSDTLSNKTEFNSSLSIIGTEKLPFKRAILIGNQWVSQNGIGFMFSDSRIVIFK